MRYITPILLFLLFPFLGFSQKEEEHKTFLVGDKVHLSVDLYDEGGVPKPVEIPNAAYALIYKYDWDGEKGDEDGRSRVEKVEKIIEKIIKTYKLKDLRVICYSLDKGSAFDKWLEMMKKKKPFKEKGYRVDYFNTNDYKAVAKKMKKIFEKLVLVGPDSKVIASAGAIQNFQVPEPKEKTPVKTTLIKGKILGEKDGKKTALKNTLVWIYNETDADTVEKTHTDGFGDFVIPLPDDEKSTYQLKVAADPKTNGKVSIVNVNGVEVDETEYKEGEFKFKMIKTTVTRLSEMPEEDVEMSYKLFTSSANNSMKIVRYISYGLASYDLAKESESTLDKIVQILKENPTVKLQIYSHTDAQGDDHANMVLSEKRSHTVVDYLVSKGIEKKRLKAFGKGESEIRNRCGNGVECSDKEHEFNRRTEFNFIKVEGKGK